MTKKSRLRRIWQREQNAEFFATKGVYFYIGKTTRNFPTAKEVRKDIRKIELKQYGMPFKTAYKKGLIKMYFNS